MHIYKQCEFAVADISGYIGSINGRTHRHSHVGAVSRKKFETTTRRGSRRVLQLLRTPYRNATSHSVCYGQ